MTSDGPALRRFKQDLRLVEEAPLAMWLATELPDASGGVMPDPFVELVADVEAEGSARIGAVACPRPHGYKHTDPDGLTVAPTPGLWTGEPCPECGAAL